jgi:uncharacterized protein YjbI with pentapeptide repeats
LAALRVADFLEAAFFVPDLLALDFFAPAFRVVDFLALADFVVADLEREDLDREDLAREDLAREDLAREDLAREDLAREDVDLAVLDPEDFEPADFFALEEVGFLVDFSADFLAGTFFPFWRASESPMAMACLRLVTFLPLPPLLRVPRLRLCMAPSTSLEAAGEYFRAICVPPGS